jgi:hypothetical protein
MSIEQACAETLVWKKESKGLAERLGGLEVDDGSDCVFARVWLGCLLVVPDLYSAWACAARGTHGKIAGRG